MKILPFCTASKRVPANINGVQLKIVGSLANAGNPRRKARSIQNTRVR